MEIINKPQQGTIFAGRKYGKADSVAFSYNAAQDTRYRKRKSSSTIQSEEKELDWHDRNKVIATLLDFRRNNPIIQGILRLRRADIVGSGIKAYPKTGNDEFDKVLAAKWNEYGENPEITGTWDITDIQKFLVESTTIFGDSALIFTDNGQVQAIEGTQIGFEGGSNYVSSELEKNRQGVKVDSNGKPISYSVGALDAGYLKNVQEIPANLLAFHYKKRRASQVRGIPDLVSVLDDLQDLNEWDEIEMIAAKVAASFAVFVKRQDAHTFEIGNRQPTNEQDTTGRLESIEPARIDYLEPNESIDVVNPSGRPNTDAIKYFMYRLQKIGTAIGVPVEFLLQTIGDSSFSASQGVVLQYQQNVIEEQRALYRTLTKWYQWRVGKWILDGELTPPAGVDAFNVKWQPQGFRWINRSAQVDADRAYLQMGACSLDDITAQFGKTAEQVQDQIKKNIQEAIERAESINQALPDGQPKISWMQFYNPYQVSGSFAMDLTAKGAEIAPQM